MWSSMSATRTAHGSRWRTDCTTTGGTAPYAITCGARGLMHTAFFGTKDEAEAVYRGMQRDLLHLCSIEDDAVLYPAIEAFVARY